MLCGGATMTRRRRLQYTLKCASLVVQILNFLTKHTFQAFLSRHAHKKPNTASAAECSYLFTERIRVVWQDCSSPARVNTYIPRWLGAAGLLDASLGT